MAKKIAFKIWSTIISAFALVSSHMPAHGSSARFKPQTTQVVYSFNIKRSKKPLLFLQKAQLTDSEGFMIAGHRSHSSHRSHYSHRSHSSHRSHYSHRSGSVYVPPSRPSRSVEPAQPSKNKGYTRPSSTDANVTPPRKSTFETLKLGQRGEAVKALQRLLATHGYACEVTGFFNFQTLTQVRAFQKAKNLKVDGVVGEKTWRALQKIE